MYSILHQLLSDRKDGEIFTAFGAWHIGYILLVLLAAVLVLFCTRRQSPAGKEKTARVFIDLAFGLYMAEFFLMPFAYGEIDIEKLPFHICTAMCVMCFWSAHSRALENWRIHFALLGFVLNLVYLIYPAGMFWRELHPLSYRVAQTLIFHGIMVIYGLLMLRADGERLSPTAGRRDLIVVVGMVLWALFGNALYTGSEGIYSHDFNWFFVVRDPFGLIDESVARFVMPVLNAVLFFAGESLVCAVWYVIRKCARRGRLTCEK